MIDTRYPPLVRISIGLDQRIGPLDWVAAFKRWYRHRATHQVLADRRYRDAVLVARLRKEGRIRAAVARGVLVKAPKSGQDLRFDLPTIGPRTIEGAAQAGLSGVAAVAANTIVAEPPVMIETADAAGLFVTGVAA